MDVEPDDRFLISWYSPKSPKIHRNTLPLEKCYRVDFSDRICFVRDGYLAPFPVVSSYKRMEVTMQLWQCTPNKVFENVLKNHQLQVTPGQDAVFREAKFENHAPTSPKNGKFRFKFFDGQNKELYSSLPFEIHVDPKKASDVEVFPRFGMANWLNPVAIFGNFPERSVVLFGDSPCSLIGQSERGLKVVTEKHPEGSFVITINGKNCGKFRFVSTDEQLEKIVDNSDDGGDSKDGNSDLNSSSGSNMSTFRSSGSDFSQSSSSSSPFGSPAFATQKNNVAQLCFAGGVDGAMQLFTVEGNQDLEDRSKGLQIPLRSAILNALLRNA